MKIIIDGPPIAKERHRCGCTKQRRSFAYDPQVKGEMQGVRNEMLKAWNDSWDSEDKRIVLETSQLAKARSFEVSLTFIFPISDREALGPQNAKKWGFLDHHVKPDLDNLEKLYLDCATGIFWSDDAQVVVCHSKKEYDKNPRTEMVIMAKKQLSIHPKVRGILEVFGPDKLKEFLNDVTVFQGAHEKFEEMVEKAVTGDKERLLTSTACLLSEFAAKHGAELAKIRKYSGLKKELETIQFINNGVLNVEQFSEV